MTTPTNRDSYAEMQAAVQAFHDKHRFKSTGGEDLPYRVTLMAEELGEIASAVTRGRPVEELAAECADLMILLIGTAISADIDLTEAFWQNMERLMERPAVTTRDRVRMSGRFGYTGDAS